MTTTTVRGPVIDVSHLKPYAFGARSALYWGTLCLCLIEGTALALLFASYLYVRDNFDVWPPTAPLRLLPGALTTGALLVSLLPIWRTAHAARTMDLRTTRRWQTISTALGVGIMALRAWEIHSLPFDWAANAYASVVWTSIGFHSADLVAEMGEMFVLTALLWKGPVEEKHFEDVEINALFWAFLVLVWIPFSVLFEVEGAFR